MVVLSILPVRLHLSLGVTVNATSLSLETSTPSYVATSEIESPAFGETIGSFTARVPALVTLPKLIVIGADWA